jgi:hypothetical protein
VRHWWNRTSCKTSSEEIGIYVYSLDGIVELDLQRPPLATMLQQQQSLHHPNDSLYGGDDTTQISDSPVNLNVASTRGRQGEKNIPSHVQGSNGAPDPVLIDLACVNGYFGTSSSFSFVTKLRADDQAKEDRVLSCIVCHNLPTMPFQWWMQANQSQGSSSVGSTSSKMSLPPASSLDKMSGQLTLPPQEHANKLVDAYFERVHVLYPFLHEGKFRARYEQLWDAEREQRETENSWLAVVNLVFAYGCEFVYTVEPGHFSQRASPFLEQAQRIVLLHAFGSADVALVQALLLLCHYLQGTLDLDRCYSFVGLMTRNAISLGLHISPDDGPRLTMVEKEFRKRLWWGCVILDQTLSMKLGRPTSIVFADAHAVGMPMEVDDQYIGELSTTPRQPSGRPSRLSFFNQTIKLSNIIHSILSTLYSTSRMSPRKQEEDTVSQRRTDESFVVGNILLLDGQLQAWWEDLPRHLKQQPEAHDDIDFQRQRIVIRIRFLQMRLLLQRPAFLLFATNKCGDEFTKAVAIASSNVCVSAAEETIRLIQSHYKRQMLNSLWYNLHCEYSLT